MSAVYAALSERNKQAVACAAPLFDQLNKAWDSIESYFREQGILCPVSFPYASIYDDKYCQGTEPVGQELIGIQKHNGKWRICVSFMFYSNAHEAQKWTPISECSIELRAKLLDFVTQLYAALVEANEKFVPEIELVITKSQSVLKTLGIAK